MDPRIDKLARLLTEHSCNIQPGEKVLITYEGDCCKKLVRRLIKLIYEKGAVPFYEIEDSQIHRELLLGCTREQVEFINELDMSRFRHMDVLIDICGESNKSELADVPSARMNTYNKAMEPSMRYRIRNTKWVLLGFPNQSMAQKAGTSLENFEDYYYDICTLDYSVMDKAMDPLVELMNRTDKVRIEGPGTDLTFSIKDIPAIKCAGEMNIPDGEVYTAPVIDSMNGIISYNTPSEEQGFTYTDIVFEVKDGKIVKASANDDQRINEFLDVDEGARYFGEFAIGVNPLILHPMKDTLFDEKICGSFHLTPGMCYEDASNGNESANHWDLVMIQRPEYGGGRIWFDDVLIRDDGRFVLPELDCLNPENLK